MTPNKIVKKFFQDYPIIFLVLIIFVVGLGAGYFLSYSPVVKTPALQESKLPKIQPAQSVLPAAPSIKQERSVKITPVAIAAPIVSAANQMVEQPLVPTAEKILTQAVPLPPAKEQKPKIVFVIDDLGYNKREAELLFSLKPPLTIAILPQLTYSKFFAEEGKKHGFETILHQPLQPQNQNEDPGPGIIRTDMTAEQVKTIIEENLSTVPGVIGVNNHMGSLATTDRRIMFLIAKELKGKNLFFLDSMTHPKSIAHNVAFALGIPTAKRDVFLDNQDNYDSIVERIKQTAQLAKENGKAVAIGHIRKNTLTALKEEIPKLEAEGFEIVTLKEMLENKSKNISSPLVGEEKGGGVS